MKKFLITLIFTNILTLNSYSAELKDCSTYSKLNPKYLACKATNFGKNAMDYQKETWAKEKKNKKKKD